MQTAVNPYEKSLHTTLVDHPADDTLHALGLSAMRDKDFALAASKFAQAIHVAGPRSEYCQSLAQALHGAGNLRQSATCYEQAIAGNPNNIQLYLGLARVLMQDGRIPAAVTIL